MATLVQSARNYEAADDTSFALAFGSNVVAGNLLVAVLGAYDDAATFNTPTDTIGTTYTQAGTLLRGTVDSPAPMLAVYYGIAPSSGANTVTMTSSVGVQDKDLRIFELSGVDGTTPLNQTNGGVGRSTTPLSGNITTTLPGFIIKCVQDWEWPATHTEVAGTPTTGWTEFGDTATGADNAYRNEAGTGTFNGGFGGYTLSLAWCCRIVAFADASGGAPAVRARPPVTLRPAPFAPGGWRR